MRRSAAILVIGLALVGVGLIFRGIATAGFATAFLKACPGAPALEQIPGLAESEEPDECSPPT